MFGSNDSKKELENEINQLKMEIDRLKERKKTEEQELKHMIRMKEEKMELESQKFKMKTERECEESIAKVKDAYRDKMEERLIKESDTIKEMYSEILQRLPNINTKLSGSL